MKITLKDLVLIVQICLVSQVSVGQPIDRKALVTRHNVVNNSFDSLGTLSVGNGKFAFSVDFTGLQSFPEAYKNGVPLGTQSEWGWHSFPNERNYQFKETLKDYDVNGKKKSYAVQPNDPKHAKEASDYFRSNPHRLHLGVVGLQFFNTDGSEAGLHQISELNQELDLWSGEIKSSFTILNEPVEVITIAHPERDLVSFRVKSKLIGRGLIKIKISFPYPTGAHSDMAASWDNHDKHKSTLSKGDNHAVIERRLDTTLYYAAISWSGKAKIAEKKDHHFEITSSADAIDVSVQFATSHIEKNPAFDDIRKENRSKWERFWMNGAAVDFSGSTDPRATELERRIVLSQYLTAIQCAGNYPPQETGLTYNSWFGKFHLEMVWWHTVHFALWNRVEMIEKLMPWYATVADEAREIAKRQGYEGLRWQKMTDPSGAETSSSIGSFLIWQQPHYIYLAELCYRQHNDKATLDKYKNLVFETADFMADYPWFDKKNNRYVLGPALIPAQECFIPAETINPPFELAYWHWGLSTAIKWAERLNIKPHEKWSEVLNSLPSLPVVDEKYIPAENVPQAYINHTNMHDHPMPLGAYGMLPATGPMDTLIMQNTFEFIWKNWEWANTWGWDFPMTAMTATRLGKPEKAIEALLMPIQTNTYLSNGHNYQDNRLRLYLPGNGGLLTAIAMMCAGYDGSTIANPGIPKDGTWEVRWEGLHKMP